MKCEISLDISSINKILRLYLHFINIVRQLMKALMN